jgi:predicted nucleic acid-binding Zn ribbon protein
VTGPNDGTGERTGDDGSQGPAVEPAGSPSRSGLEIAREALAAARAEVRRRGGRAGAGDPGRSSTGAAAPSGWRSRRAAAERRSGAHPDERDPQPLDSALGRLLAERGWQTDAAVGGAMGRWGAIVGPELAGHCEPVSCQRGELVVQADSTAWATQLRLLAPTLARRLNEDLGAGTVATVTVLGPRPPSWRRGPLSVRGRGPRDTYG